MKLTLRIENFDYLPDGGPLEFSVSGRGMEVGRDSQMDLTLPDPNRHISSRHFEVLYRDRKFLLNDISTNGTFVYGQSMRVSSPFQLTHNDRLQVGHYIIRVLIEDPNQQNPNQGFGQGFASPAPNVPPPGMPAMAPVADPWSMVPTPAPMPAPSRMAAPLAGQYGDSLVEISRPAPASIAPSPPPSSLPLNAAQPGFGAAPARAPEPVQRVVPPTAPPAQTPPVNPPTAGAGAGAEDILDAICRGAGLPPGSLSRGDPTQTAEEIGRCMRIATHELMQLLSARAQAKQMVKSGSRTMIGGTNNSPLKFKPNATEAMMTMFVQRPESYLSATTAIQQGFADVGRHQMAVMAALQPALANLLDGLSPESIEERTTGGLMSSKKTRAWETFVERWDAKTHPHEHGMLTVFLNYFADAYDVALKKLEG